LEIEQCHWTRSGGWQPTAPGRLEGADLAFVFGATDVLREPEPFGALRRSYPDAWLFGCSTAGEICDTRVTDDSVVVTAVGFESTTVAGAAEPIGGSDESAAVGERLAARLPHEGLVHVLVLSDGQLVNGSDLVRGPGARLPAGVTVTGGLAGDGARFAGTLVIGDGPPATGTVAAVGLYGDRLRVGYGSLGGWDPFGPERLITAARGNVLYELDGRSALELYKTYLGQHAAELPAAGLLFPLSIRASEHTDGVVRTILAVDEREQSLTFAGDVPEGAYARLMKANFDRLIDGAVGAARTSYEAVGTAAPDLALLISCVGRKLVLKQRIEEEVEGVREVLGPRPVLTGFYSYGEISPFTPSARCELHNQTMTITTLAER
jgi:hypothetical protein